LIFYLDASVCVSLLTRESGTDRTVRWRESHSSEPLAASLWVHAEVASALSTKVRMGSLSVAERSDALTAWAMLRAGMHNIEIDADAFTAAADMLARHELGLRAGDALHLAIAAAHGCTLVTLDERMAKAAPEVGVPVAEVG
jgi:predicted nucleic acid-binding protein